MANAFAESSSVQANERAALKAQLAEPWTPPVMKKSATAPVKKRQAKTKIKYGASDRALEEVPENAAFKRIDYLPEPLVPTTESTHTIERKALSAALQRYLNGSNTEAVEPLEDFTSQYSDSSWTPAVLLNLGIIAYDTGYFSRALNYWKAAWILAKNNTDRHSVAIANRAIAEYAKMCARVGRKDDLAIVFEETKDRIFQGTAKVLMDSAREGYWSMLNKGGIAYLSAAHNLLSAIGRC